MKFYDMHTHTHFSHDSKANPEEMVKNAIEKGFSGIAFTEHCDVDYFFEERDTLGQLGKSINTALRLNEQYSDKIEVLSGIEISGSFRYPENTKATIDRYGKSVDAILCSVHVIDWKEHPEAISEYRMDTFTESDLKIMSDKYYDDVYTMLNFLDGEILCHLTYPGRYANLVYGIVNYSYSDYLPKIKEILKLAAKKDMALEVNTSNMAKFNNGFYMVDKYLIELYREVGGRLISLGSDAHSPEHIGCDFENALKIIKSAGFSEYCYFKNRNPFTLKIN